MNVSDDTFSGFDMFDDVERLCLATVLPRKARVIRNPSLRQILLQDPRSWSSGPSAISTRFLS